MNIKKVKLKDMKLSEYNPRIHNDQFLKTLKRSMDAYGYVEPIVWNKKTGNIVGGHARYKVLQAEGVKEIDVVVVDLSEIDEKALNVALNKVSGEWDDTLLSPLIEELQDHGVDIESLGFKDIEIEKLMLDPGNLTDSFELPDGDKEPFQIMTFTVAEKQAEFIKHQLDMAKEENTTETYGNENSNGNALFRIVQEWAEQKTSL